MDLVNRWGLLDLVDASRPRLPGPERLLIVGPPFGLGDALMVLPALRRLQRAAPQTQLTWLGRAAHRPVVSMMGVHDFRASGDPVGFDAGSFVAILSFADVDAGFLGDAGRLARVPVRIGRAAGRARPRWLNHLVDDCRLGWPRHTAQRNLRLLLPFGHGTPATSTELAANRPLAPAAVTLPSDLPARGHVVLHPFSLGHGREWPLQHWVELARLLAAQDVPVVFTGSGDERDRLAHAWPPAQRPPGVLDAGGRLDIGQLSVLLHGASAMTASGTGPLHLAAALGTPALGLYPPRRGVALDRWAPLGRAAVGVQAYRRCPHGLRCENAACRCMAALAPQRVAQALHPLSRHALNLGPLAPWVVAAPGNERLAIAQSRSPLDQVAAEG